MNKIFNHRDIEKRFEKWLDGKDHKLKSGQFIKIKGENDSIGVVQFALKEYETYHVKWKIGKNAWEIQYGTVHSTRVDVIKVDVNPFTYKLSQRYPGPSQTQIEALNEKFNKIDEQRYRNRTSREIDVLVEAFEEDLSRNSAKAAAVASDEDDETVDSIVDTSLEEDTSIIRENGTEKKILEIISEE